MCRSLIPTTQHDVKSSHPCVDIQADRSIISQWSQRRPKVALIVTDLGLKFADSEALDGHQKPLAESLCLRIVHNLPGRALDVHYWLGAFGFGLGLSTRDRRRGGSFRVHFNIQKARLLQVSQGGFDLICGDAILLEPILVAEPQAELSFAPTKAFS